MKALNQKAQNAAVGGKLRRLESTLDNEIRIGVLNRQKLKSLREKLSANERYYFKTWEESGFILELIDAVLEEYETQSDEVNEIDLS